MAVVSLTKSQFKSSHGTWRTMGSMICILAAMLGFAGVSQHLPQTASHSSTIKQEQASSKPSYDLAFHESLGFFDDIDESDWRLYQGRFRSEPIFKDLTAPDPVPHTDYAKIALWMLENVDPMFTCPHLRRIGGRGDGPKWICDPHRLRNKTDCLVYSVGSNGNYMFEDSLIRAIGDKHCEIHVFDPSPRFARPNDPEQRNIRYHAWGLKSSYVDMLIPGTEEYISLNETQQRLGYGGKRIDIFKIDCEGCEWDSYKDWLDESVDIRQIQVEVHGGRHPAHVTLKDFFMAFFDRGFVPFSKEAHTYPSTTSPVGRLFEFAFIRLSPSFFGNMA